MGRELKFRAWDGHYKKWLKPFEWPYGHSGLWLNIENGELTHIEESGDNDVTYTPFENITLCQFTGLKDKNGKDIYEGDICEQITPNHTKIKMVCRWGTFQRTMDTGWTVDISGFCFERSDGLMALPIVKNWMGKRDLETLEVIGNIYENPELFNP